MVETRGHCWLSNAEAARYLGCSEHFLNRDRFDRHHGIPYSNLGRLIRYEQSDLDDFLLHGKVSRPPKAAAPLPAEEQPPTLVQKKKRGRPPGVKNRPKHSEFVEEVTK